MSDAPSDWSKLTSLVLGTVGTALGVFNYVVARRDRTQREKHGYALMLLALEPLVDKLLSVPLEQPTEMEACFPRNLSCSLEELLELLDLNKKDLVVLVPELASCILNLRASVIALLRRVHDPGSIPVNCLQEASELFRAGWGLAQFRGYAGGFSMKLDDQREPTAENWSGDPKVKLLYERWRMFNRAHQRAAREA